MCLFYTDAQCDRTHKYLEKWKKWFGLVVLWEDGGALVSPVSLDELFTVKNTDQLVHSLIKSILEIKAAK